MVDRFKTLALWPLPDLDFGRGKGREADGGPMGKDSGIILRQDSLNRHTWVYPNRKIMGAG